MDGARRHHWLTKTQRAQGDHGVTLVLLVLSLAAVLALAGLAIDGGRLFASRRQMQNAADASAMAGARALDRFKTKQTTDASAVYNAALQQATNDGASSTITCRLLNFNRTQDLGACPTAANATIAKAAWTVRVSVNVTESTIFMQALGMSNFSSNASAAAVVGKPAAGNGPFLICANADGFVPPIVTNPSGANPPDWVINPDAIGHNYVVYGNSIKDGGRDCGDPDASFRGLADDTNGPFQIPGWWDTKTGNKTGPTQSLIGSGNVCSGDFGNFPTGCVVVLPLCTKGNDANGAGFQMYCVDLGLFQITVNNNHDIEATFLGRAVLNAGGVVGPPDANGARIVVLAE
jgi:Flp pilus assembly protein TadG